MIFQNLDLAFHFKEMKIQCMHLTIKRIYANILSCTFTQSAKPSATFAFRVTPSIAFTDAFLSSTARSAAAVIPIAVYIA